MKKSNVKLCLFLSVPFLLSSIGYGSWIINDTKEENIVVSGPKVQDTPVAYIVGSPDVKYTKIEKALDVAKSGDIVCLIPNKKSNSNKLEYEISNDCEIKENVTLVIPTDEESISSLNSSNLASYIKKMTECNNDNGSPTSSFADENKLRITVSIADGKTLKNNGTLIVGGYLSGGTNGAGRIGQTAFLYSRIVLGLGSNIIQSNSSAITHCYGYIKRSAPTNNSCFEIKSGSVYIPFVVNDYKGFNASYAMSRGAVSDEGCSPFNQYEFPNIATKVKVYPGGNIKGVVNAYFRFPQLTVDEVAHKTFDLLGGSSSNLIQLNNENSYIEFDFDDRDHSQQLDIYNGCIMNNLPFQLEVSGFKADMNTSTAYFPIPFNMSVRLRSNSGSYTFNLSKQMLKVLPGGYFSVGSGCNVKCSSIICYSAFVDGSEGNAKYTNYSLSESTKYPLKEGGIIMVESGGSIVGSNLAGTIYCDDESSINVSNTSITSKEPWTIGSGKTLMDYFMIKDYLEIYESLCIVPISYLSRKKMFFFSNCFSSTNGFKPEIDLYIDDTLLDTIVGTQKVEFIDDASEVRMDFKKNVYLGFTGDIVNGLSPYSYKSSKQIGNFAIVGVTNSSLSISSSNNGINEFEVQSITIKSTQDKIDGKDPLFVGGNLGLTAVIVDDTKVYNAVVEWSSSDESTATVDQDGTVTGAKLGKVKIMATCQGKTANYETEVIPDGQVIEPTNMWIQSSNGDKGTEMSGESNYKGWTNNNSNNFQYHAKVSSTGEKLVFSLVTQPLDAYVSGIEWTYKSLVSKSYMSDPSDSSKKITDVSSPLGGPNNASIKEVTVNFSEGTGQNPDNEILTCTVYGTDGKKTKLLFVIDYDTGCLAEGTEILMLDGNVKKVEELQIGDLVKVFNHETGKIDVSPIIFITHKNQKSDFYSTIELFFERDIKIKIAKDHALFDRTTNRYEIIDSFNYQNFIDHEFAIYSNERVETVKLKSAMAKREVTRVYCPVTAFHMNLFANKLLTMPTLPYDIHGLYNIFDLDTNMKYDEEKKSADIQKYGLFSYEEFVKIIPISIDAFNVSPAIYLKVSLGKGLISEDKIRLCINYLLNNDLID